jgi:hypothetical protein
MMMMMMMMMTMWKTVENKAGTSLTNVMRV